MKKLLFTLLAFMIPICTMFAQDFTYDGVNYTVISATEKTCKTKAGTSAAPGTSYSNKDLVLPEKVLYGGYEFTIIEIGNYSFYKNTISSISIPNSVTSIGNYAFAYCSSLRSVVIPILVTSIGKYAFYKCAALTSVNIPNSVTSIGKSAFSNCAALTSVNIPNSVTSIEQSAFSNCDALTNVNIPNSVTSIGEQAFYHCDALTNVNIPNSVTSIGMFAFLDCYKIEKVEITDLEAWCKIQFSSMYSNPLYAGSKSKSKIYLKGEEITELKIPDSITKINDYAFCGWVGLRSVYIPNSVTSIGNDAFRYCSSLTNVYIGENISKISYSAFSYCTNIIEIYCLAINPPNIYYNDTWDNYYSFEDINSNQIDLIVPLQSYRSYLTTEPWESFKIHVEYDYNDIKYVTNDSGYAVCKGPVSDSEEIRNPYIIDAFPLEDLTVRVSSIAPRAFENCSELTGILTIPSSMKNIGEKAFTGCPSLTGVQCLSSTPPICDGVVFDETVYNNAPLVVNNVSEYKSATEWKKFKNINNSIVTVDGITYEINFGTETATAISVSEEKEGPLNIPNQITYNGKPYTVTAIGDYAFAEHNKFSGPLIIPATIETIGESAFFGCSEIKSLRFEDSDRAIEINNNSFYGLSLTNFYMGRNCVRRFLSNETLAELSSLEIGSKVTVIPASAFQNCSKLTSITLPEGLTEIASDAFRGCSGVTELTIPETVTAIGNGAFIGCPITNLTFNATNCTVCGSESNPAFDSTIKELTFGNNVTVIPPYMLYKGSQIQNLVIPNRVIKVGDYAFNNNNILKSVTVGAGLPSVNATAFSIKIPKIYWLGNTPPSNYSDWKGLVNYTSNDQYKSFETGGETAIIYPFLSSKFEVDGVIYVPVSPSDRTCDVIDCNYYATSDEVVIPEKVAYQGVEMSVYNISDYAFYRNPYFSILALSEIIDNIGNSAFEGCTEIKSLTFPAGVSSLGNFSFAKCHSVEEITFVDEKIDTDVIKLGYNGSEGLFYDCPLTKLYIGRKLEYQAGPDYGYSPFARIKTLKEVEIADYEVKVSDFEFYNCTALVSLNIGNGVKSIGNWAYSGCYSLEYYSAGASVETIGEEAFSDCTSVTEYYSYSVIPPVCGNQSLDDINKWICTLYVPADSRDEYQAASQWKDFFFIEEMDAPQVAEIVLDQTSATIAVGEYLKLTATILPRDAEHVMLTWTSSDESIATVSQNGLVTAISEGHVSITASYGDVYAVCEVTVTGEAGIDSIYGDEDTSVVVYNMYGIRMNVATVEELSTLQPGFYIVNGKKMFLK